MSSPQLKSALQAQLIGWCSPSAVVLLLANTVPIAIPFGMVVLAFGVGVFGLFRNDNTRLAIAIPFLTVAARDLPAAMESVGDVLPPATDAGMDIHHINTAEGNATLLVLPDHTTLLIDCGSNQNAARPPRFKAPPRPDASRLPGEWVARYIKRVHPRGADAALDYALVSHFHANRPSRE